MNDETTRLYEDYVKNVLKIPYCDFSDINNRIISEIVHALTLLYKKYSFFDRVLCCIGTPEDVKAHIELIYFSQPKYIGGDEFDVNDFPWDLNKLTSWFAFTTMAHSDGRYYVASKRLEDNYANYFSITIYDVVKKADISNRDDISATHVGRMPIFHEFGHLLDFFMHISDSEEFQEIIAGHDIEKEVSKYATTDSRELLADAFMQYVYIKEKSWEPNNLINQIGELVDKKYIEFINTHSKEKYCFNKQFSISNTDVKDDFIKYPRQT